MLERLKTWYQDGVFVGTNWMMKAGIIKDKWKRRELSEKLSFGFTELKGAYKPSWVMKLMPKFEDAA